MGNTPIIVVMEEYLTSQGKIYNKELRWSAQLYDKLSEDLFLEFLENQKGMKRVDSAELWISNETRACPKEYRKMNDAWSKAVFALGSFLHMTQTQYAGL